MGAGRRTAVIVIDVALFSNITRVADALELVDLVNATAYK